jgi:hypothetical protein
MFTGWEEVQVLDWQALRTLVALGWVAAGFLYGLGGSPGLVGGATAGQIGGLGAPYRSSSGQNHLAAGTEPLARHAGHSGGAVLV